MLTMLKNKLRAPYRAFSARFLDDSRWKQRRYAAPSPVFVKRQVLLRNSLPNATWVETGTYLGETTEFLARNARKVFSIEPEQSLFKRADHKFKSNPTIAILNGTSEQVFPTLLPKLSGAVNFWLDGHYSAGVTFQGTLDTPVLVELATIQANLERFSQLRVLVDDVRCFDPSIPEYSTYPSIDELVDWARRNGMHWHIEHDIFVAKKG
jgi:hypothetical protein